MFVTPAFAQASSGGGLDIFSSLLPIVAMIVIFYFLLIRPQQQKVKKHKEMVEAVRRGDSIVTNGGILGKVVKVVDETEVLIEVAEGVRIRALKHMIADVRVKGEPVTEERPQKTSKK